MKEEFEESKNILNAYLKLQNFCSNTPDKKFNKMIFSIRFRILFLINKYKKISPSLLVEQLQIAKSNIAFFCKRLLLEGLIKSRHDDFDRRILYYGLTKKGEEVINKNLEILQSHLTENFDENKLQSLKKHIKFIEETFSKIRSK